AQDITERQRAQGEARGSALLLRAVLEGTTDAVFVKDARGRYLLINPAGARFLGRAAEEILGRDDSELVEAESAARVMAADRRITASGCPETVEMEVTAAGATHTFQATKAPYRDETGAIAGVIGISRDVTGLRALEGQLRQAAKMEAVGRL